jgi:hypothetical protein
MRCWVLVASLVCGCHVITSRQTSSAGMFVTDIEVTRAGLVADRCTIDYVVTEGVFVFPVVTQLGILPAGEKTRSTELMRGRCEATPPVALPGGMLPPDGLDGAVPRWCLQGMARWREATATARREHCIVLRAELRRRADRVATLKERAAIYQSMPDCDVAMPAVEAPVTRSQQRAWSLLAEDCRAFTGATSPGGER